MGWQFSRVIVGIDCFALWCLGLQLGKITWLIARESICRDGSSFTCLDVGAGCWLKPWLGVLSGAPVCSLFKGVDFLTLWRPLSSWTYRMSQSFNGRCLSEQGRSHIIFYDIASEVIECHCYNILFIKAIKGSPKFKEKESKCHLLLSYW